MKKLIPLLLLAFVATSLPTFSQQVSSRAKAMRMMTYARAEYMVKDIKVFAQVPVCLWLKIKFSRL